MKVIAIDHVQLAIPPGGEPAARAFYGEVLGLTEIPKPEDMRPTTPIESRSASSARSAEQGTRPPWEEGTPAGRARGGLWFQAGPVQIHLGVEPDMRPSAKAHPALVVADLDAGLARIAAAGFRWKDADDIRGTRRGHTWDPFGNRIELIEAR